MRPESLPTFHTAKVFADFDPSAKDDFISEV